MKYQKWTEPSDGSKGGARDAPQILSISCIFGEILAKSYVGAPLGSWCPLLGEILDPPLEPSVSDTWSVGKHARTHKHTHTLKIYENILDWDVKK